MEAKPALGAVPQLEMDAGAGSSSARRAETGDSEAHAPTDAPHVGVERLGAGAQTGFSAPPAPALDVLPPPVALAPPRSPTAPPSVPEGLAGLLSRAAQTLGGLFEAVRTGIGVRGSLSLDEYGMDHELTRHLAPLSDFFLERYWRLSVEAADNVPTGPVLLVANHSGALPFDGPVLQQALWRSRSELLEPRWLVEDQIFHAPFVGTLLNRLGAVRANPENAVRLLDEGRPVIVFPEGIQGMGKSYRERYQLKRFGRGGFAKLALRTGAPILPVAIVGAEETMPLIARIPGPFLGFPYFPITPLGPIPLPARWSIRFGEPLEMRRPAPGEPEDLAEVQRLTERTRDSIAGMLEGMLRERASIFT